MPTASRTEVGVDADLGRRLETRAQRIDIDAVRDRNAGLLGGAVQRGAQCRIIGRGHVRKARTEAFVVWTDQRILARQVDVVVDDHQRAGRVLSARRLPAALVMTSRSTPEAAQDADRHGQRLRRMTFIGVKASLHAGERMAGD